MKGLFYSTGQVARQLGTTQATVRVLCENGLIAAETTPGGQWRVGPFLAGRDTLDGWATLWPLDGFSEADETIRPLHEWAGTFERYWQHPLGAVNLDLPKFQSRSAEKYTLTHGLWYNSPSSAITWFGA